MSETLVKIDPSIDVPGSAPVVLLGPNGSGKTRHAANMAGWNNADLIGALRNIALEQNIAMSPYAQAKQQLAQQLQSRRSQPWQMSSEINQLFSKLIAEDSSSAMKFRDGFSVDANAKPETTKLMRLTRVWSRLFPGRSIDFSSHRPVVRSEYNTAGGEYLAQQMSDGERVALYLAGRVLDSESQVIIVDEPEVHFHSRLAARFWTELEALRDDCRFVYITHDLPFALSRQDAQFVIISPNTPPQLVALEDGIPTDIAQSLLAAASFSIHARRVIFCEGTEGTSHDQALYSAWFHEVETAVVPVGGSKDVVRCSVTFGQSKLVAGLDACGLIDRDYWPDRFLDSLSKEVTPLPVHEVENLFCLQEVVMAVCAHFGKTVKESTDLYDSFIKRATAKFTGGLLAKQVSSRFRQRCEHEFSAQVNLLTMSDSLDELQQLHITALNSENWEPSLSVMFVEERATVQKALANGGMTFHRIFPGKSVIRFAADTVGMSVDAYVKLVCASLVATEPDALADLGAKLDAALSPHLPKRKLENPA